MASTAENTSGIVETITNGILVNGSGSDTSQEPVLKKMKLDVLLRDRRVVVHKGSTLKVCQTRKGQPL